MTKNQTERGYLNISKMVFAFAGGMVVSAATLPLVNFFGGDSAAWQKTFLIYGVVAIVFFLVVFFTTREAVTEEAEKSGKKEDVSILKALLSLVKNKYWMILLLIFFLNSVVNAFIGVNVYYGQYIMNDTSLVGSLSIFQNVASFVAFAACTVLIRKVGKQKIAVCGVAISFCGYALVLENPTSYAVLYIAAVIKGFGNAALSGVMYGMLADTVEYNDWHSGIRAEGLVFSANSIGQKVGSGIGSAVLGWVLAAFGFVSSSSVQPESALNGIRTIFLYVPLVVFAIMFIVLMFYKLGKEYDGIITDLAARDQKD